MAIREGLDMQSLGKTPDSERCWETCGGRCSLTGLGRANKPGAGRVTAVGGLGGTEPGLGLVFTASSCSFILSMDVALIGKTGYYNLDLETEG